MSMTDPQEILRPRDATPSGGEDWTEPRMEHVPRPTYWPVVMALGTVLIFWGVATTMAISIIGLGLFVIGLTGWIWEMRHGA
jgi:hypothetical protein